ncbi:alpha-amylase family glycosyl hydrolase [Halanaerobacter jeridensis]|uniref:Glycosidase n=1 Tax=Halanaerobacter jeridensis TaxID=706427 RepID=A0A938XU29_9FIRM|nr:alpha-amylase family glycosyl hydrolase [Halanaerobacter jeridensis]MBM7557924.1 glycosidase [Halanaerobacter jeridensis]
MGIIKNKLQLLSVLLILVLVLGGCTNTRNEKEEFITSTGSLRVTVYLQNIITNNSSSALAVEDQIDLSNVEITITNNENHNLVEQDDKDVSADASEVVFSFDDLSLDDSYDIEVKVKDDEGHYVYQGSDQAVISSTDATKSVDELQFLATKNVIVDLHNLPSDVDSGTVSLVTKNAGTYTEEINVNPKDNSAVANFSAQNIEVGQYNLKLSLSAKENEVFSDTKSELVVLPNQVTKINLDCKNGSGGLGVSVVWESAPEAPQRFSTQILGDTQVKLNWKDENLKYNIYRSQTNNFSQANKISFVVEQNTYLDQNIEDDTNYYYWIKAVAESGISSDVVGPRKASIPEFSGSRIYYYSAQNKSPSIVVETENGENITEKMGYSNTQPAKMKAAAEAPQNWYLFKIADRYLPQSKEELVIQFDGKEKEINSTSTENAWYDGDKWHAKPPYKLSKPQISITPAGGIYPGSQIITINVSGAHITSKSAELAGTKIDLQGQETKIQLKDYLKEVGESATLEVSAVNSKGRSEKSFEFKRIKEESQTLEQGFSWQNTTAYYVLLDRFYNANTENDNSYGRPQVDAMGSKIGTFHGGDIVGLTEKIKAGYFDKLGVNTLFISAPYEQVHGFVGGGKKGEFAKYAYDGYHALDYTAIDKNIGTVTEFRKFMNTAHKHDLRVVMDVVLNHPGKNTIQDMNQYNFGNWVDKSLSNNWAPTSSGSWVDYQNKIDYTSGQSKWANWWGPNWIRYDLPGYDSEGKDKLTKNLHGFPDFKTEVNTDQGLPPVLKTKWQQEKNNHQQWIIPEAQSLRKDLGIAPRDYLIKWLSAWVREFGIDGFRCRAVSNVGKERWGELKGAAQQALKNWRQSHPQSPGAKWNEDFWLLGEVNNHGVVKNDYYNDNNQDQMTDFDALLNTHFSNQQSIEQIGQLWGNYAIKINNDDHFNVLSYISSMNRGLAGMNDKITAGTKLLLTPGAVQIFYGDEINRSAPAYLTPQQAAKADYPWDKQKQKVLRHWRKLGQFRKEHPAVGAGQQIELAKNTYGRTWDRDNDGRIEDKVVFKVNANGREKVRVKDIFADGTEVHNFYTGRTAVVKDAMVQFEAVNGVILIEKFAGKSIE